MVALKEYDGETRPSEMIFDAIEAWVRVDDLPLDVPSTQAPSEIENCRHVELQENQIMRHVFECGTEDRANACGRFVPHHGALGYVE